MSRLYQEGGSVVDMDDDVCDVFDDKDVVSYLISSIAITINHKTV